MSSWRDKLRQHGEEEHGMEVEKSTKKKKNTNRQTQVRGPMNLENNHTSNIGNRDRARSPYNFVPLNEKVVEAEVQPGSDELPFNKYHHDRHTGWIDIEVETRTPFYIRDSLNQEEQEEKIEAEKKDNKNINSEFFSPSGRPQIPGSSLRGMVRTLIEVVSFGKFGFTDSDRRLNYRTFDSSSLRHAYQQLMSARVKGAFCASVSAGILEKVGRTYRIKPSQEIEGTQYYRVNFNGNYVTSPDRLRIKEFEIKKVFFQPVPPSNHQHGGIQLRYALLEQGVSTHHSGQFNTPGYLVSSGRLNNKHMHWVINEPVGDQNQYRFVPDRVIQEYKDDTNRDIGIDLLAEAAKGGTPCFYVTDSHGEIFAFGHTGMFRLPYKKTIEDHIPSSLLADNTLDIAEAMFGKETEFATRVYFEDSILDEEQDPSQFLGSTTIPKILSSPKPTACQHYLVQTSDNISNLKHYNESTAIRGHKFYWHKSENVDWEEKEFTCNADKLENALKRKNLQLVHIQELMNRNGNDIDLDLTGIDDFPKQIRNQVLNAIVEAETQYTIIQPIKTGAKFKGRIRFENLSDVELGALLFALQLPEGCFHKIGMAKPLGLGSIQITPRLYLSDRKTRYQSLWQEWGSIRESDKINDFKNKFETYVKNSIGFENDLWNHERLTEFKTLLNYGEGCSRENQLEYMSIDNNDFRYRPVLPKPSDVPSD